jgi:hypothetical protein
MEEVETAPVAEETAIAATPEPRDDNMPEAGLETAQQPEVAAEEFDTIEYDGKEYQIPKALKPAVMKDADYTRKTQETAAIRRELEERAQRIEQQSKVSDEEIDLRADRKAIERELKKYETVNWSQLEQDDPAAAQSHWRYFQQLKDARTDVAGKLTEAEGKRTAAQQEDLAKRVADTEAYAKENIKGWTPETNKQVVEFARSQDIPDSFMMENMSPQLYRVLRLASIGEAAEKRAATAPKPASALPQVTETVGAKRNPPAANDLASADMETYVAIRKKQEAARR